MVKSLLGTSSISLLYPSKSVVLQVWEWLWKNHSPEFRLVGSRNQSDIHDSLQDTSMAVIDATDFPADAVAAMECGVRVLGSEKVVIYTERTHDKIEVLARSRGVQFLLGPLSQIEWSCVLELASREPVKSASRPSLRGYT